MRNFASEKPSEMLKEIPGCKINPLQFQNLRCLAATAVSKYGLRYKQEVPAVLEDFVEAH